MENIQGTLNSVASGVNGLQSGFNNVFKQPTQLMNYLPDASEFIGPTYDYSGELKAPSDFGINMGNGDFTTPAQGVDYYAGALGYGKSVGLSKLNDDMKHQSPMGLNFFLKTGGTCSNGANMYEYVSTVPQGIPGELGDKLAKEMKGIRLQGLAPGIVGDAAAALNPAPFFSAVTGSGFARCTQVTEPVGDYNGNLRSKNPNVTRPWIDTSKEKITMEKGKRKGIRRRREEKPYATHWVFKEWISADEYNKEKKVYPKKDAAGNVIEEFQDGGSNGLGTAPVTAGLLFGALFIGLVVFTTMRQ
jgi:hypothetical protein